MAIKTNAKEHFSTSVNFVFFSHEKLLPWTEQALFFSLFWLTLLVGHKLSLFCFKSYRFRNVVISLFVRLEITLQWSPVA